MEVKVEGSMETLGIKQENVKAYVWRCKMCAKKITLLNLRQMKNSIEKHLQAKHPGYLLAAVANKASTRKKG